MLKKEWNSLMAAVNGIFLMRKEKHFKLIFVCAIAILCVMFLLPTTTVEKSILLMCAVFVLALEMMNSAIEHLANKVDTNFDNLIKSCKDIAAGAVLLSSLLALVIGGMILIPYLLVYCKS